MNHDCRVVTSEHWRGGKYHQARCSCGWRGRWWDDKHKARRAMDSHLRARARAERQAS